MSEHKGLLTRRLQLAHEAAFSANTAVTAMAFLFLAAPRSVTGPLFRMDVALSRYLHLFPSPGLLKDSLTGGHFAFFLPAVALAALICMVLHFFSPTSATCTILRSAAGILAIGGPAAWWLWATYASDRRYGWRPLESFQFYEVVLVLAGAIFLLARKQRFPSLGVLAILMIHYVFWLWNFGPYNISISFFNSQILPITALCSGLVWVFYLSRLVRS